jgi:hypothetical protein
MTDTVRVSAYYDIIGPAPTCTPGDTATALSYLNKINKAIALGGWSPFEMNRLRGDLKRKWEARALGHDARFNAVGTQGGRLPADMEYRLKHQNKRTADGTRRNKLGGGGSGRPQHSTRARTSPEHPSPLRWSRRVGTPHAV